MTVKNFFSAKALVLFIFLCWAEILIFTMALFPAIWAGDLFNLITEKIKGNSYYALSPHIRLAPKIFFLFCFLGAAQFLFSDFIKRRLRSSFYLFVYICDACAVSVFFINSIIGKTDLRAYNLLWLGTLVVMLAGCLPILLAKEEKAHSHTPFKR